MSAASAADFLKTMWDDYRSDRARSGRLPSLEYEYIFSHMLQAADNGATMAQILGQCSSEPRGEPPFGPLNPVPCEEAIAEAEAFGFDLTSPLYSTTGPRQPK